MTNDKKIPSQMSGVLKNGISESCTYLKLSILDF